jgi:hypothetical protein
MWTLLACAPPPPPPVGDAVLAVLADLDLAKERSLAGEVEARESVYAAYARFETAVEPAARERLGPSEVLALEVAFARAAHAQGAAVEPAYGALVDRLERLRSDP